MSEEDALKEVLSRLVRVLEVYVGELERVEPGSKESARLSDSITKLLGVAKNFKDKLGPEETDIVKLMTSLMARKERRMAVKREREPNVEAAIEYLRLALLELGVEA